MQYNNRLLVDSVHLEFERLQVLQSAFITAETGRVTGVLGRNGCGKSCLFKCIMGGIKPQNIFIRFNDEPDTDYGHIGERVKYLPQNTFIPPKMTLGEAFDTLVITGPNTGGKTVSLKTLGLLTLMAMCGLMIPADDNSKISVFDNIL